MPDEDLGSTAKRMPSGLVLKWRNGDCFVIHQRYGLALLQSSQFTLTEPSDESTSKVDQQGGADHNF